MPLHFQPYLLMLDVLLLSDLGYVHDLFLHRGHRHLHLLFSLVLGLFLHNDLLNSCHHSAHRIVTR